MSAEHPVHTLSAETARKIAAGEVIDRPNAVVRELMDNAIDSGASSVSVEIAGGGIDKIRIVDNGCGMTKEDLSACARPHATSKIESETDLLKLSTLGFRGEALSSIAAVARLSIISGGWKMRASITEDHIIEQVSPVQGTIVQSEGLFENFPARRQFLKRPATEGVMCRNTFIEKTLPRPDMAFIFTADSEQRLNLPAGQTIVQRFVQAYGINENEKLFYEVTGKAPGITPDWSFRAVIGEPAVSRTSKKDILIFVNGRRITEYSLVQAIEYGGQGYFPNGTYPVAALFVTMNPALVDFNIHPAKKEARFQDISPLHHAVSSGIRAFFHQYTVKTMTENAEPDENAQKQFEELNFAPETHDVGRTVMHTGNSEFHTHGVREYSEQKNDGRSKYFTQKASPDQTPAAETYRISHEADSDTAVLADAALAENGIQTAPEGTFRFVGSALGTFIIAEKNNTLYIIDKHAAHERILYNRIMADCGKRQTLLVPYVIETENKNDDSYLEGIQAELDSCGFTVKNCGNGRWEIYSVPERWKGTETDLYHALLDKRLEPDEVISAIAATSACKAAVKDGYILDDSAAAELAREALSLPDPHCPHGRPIWTTISREQLFALVKRT